MSDIPAELRFTETHEWVRLEADGTVTVGISDYAQQALGEVAYTELPEIGSVCDRGETVAVVESPKAAADVYAPVGGEVIEVNEAVTVGPGMINESPYESWLFKLRPSSTNELDELLDASRYKAGFSD